MWAIWEVGTPRTRRGDGRDGAACYGCGIGKLSPIESEFDSTEDAEAYERWFRAKVEASLKDGRPSVPHATVMTDLDAIIDQAEGGPKPHERPHGCDR